MGASGKQKESGIQRFIHGANFKSYSGVILIIIVLGALLAILTPGHTFLTANNIMNILRQVAVYGVLSVGMAFVMIGAGIDLSVGATAGFCGALTCILVTNGVMGFLPALVIGVIVGTLIGLLLGIIITATNIPPFVATLAGMTSIRGFAYIICDGKPIGNLPENMLNFGTNRILGIPILILVMLLVFIIGGIVLSKTSFGRSVYAVGGNATAARLAGINIKRVWVLTYAISGFCAGLGGIMLACRNASAQPTAGTTFETEAIAGCAMGGVAFTGGSGTATGVFFGVFLMGIINNGMNLLGINSYWQLVVKGIIIVVAVVYSMRANDTNTKPKKSKKANA